MKRAGWGEEQGWGKGERREHIRSPGTAGKADFCLFLSG